MMSMISSHDRLGEEWVVKCYMNAWIVSRGVMFSCYMAFTWGSRL